MNILPENHIYFRKIGIILSTVSGPGWGEGDLPKANFKGYYFVWNNHNWLGIYVSAKGYLFLTFLFLRKTLAPILGSFQVIHHKDFSQFFIGKERYLEK